MCGVIGLIEEQASAPKDALQALKEMEYRGYDSWGVAWTQHKKCIVKKNIGKIGEATLPKKAAAQLSLGHTRWATHGGVTVANAHPHLSADGRFALVHNGVVENYLELKAKLLQEGYIFQSQTDSEVILAIFETEISSLEKGHKSSKEAIVQALKLTFEKLQGSNAIVLIDARAQCCLAVRQGSPLLFAKTDDKKMVVSDLVALIGQVKTYALVPENAVLYFDQNEHECIDLFTSKKFPFDWKAVTLQKNEVALGTFQHYLQKEIGESSQVIRAVVAAYSGLHNNQLKMLASKLQSVVYLVGCGSAYHVALFGAALLAESGRQAYAFSGNEFTAWRSHAQDHVSVIFISQSGETADLLVHARWLKEHQIPFHCLVNKPLSSLSQLADVEVSVLAGVEQAVVASKSVIAQLACLLLLANTPQTPVVELSQLLSAATYIDTMVQDLPKSSAFKNWCQELAVTDHFFVLGRGLLQPIALETALKLKEAAYVHAEGFSAGELKHGVLALVERGTQFLCLASIDENFDLDRTSAVEVTAREGRCVGLITDSKSWIGEHFSHPNFGTANALIAAVFGQLLAYEIAKLKGIDPDKPRNLAKSVTVR